MRMLHVVQVLLGFTVLVHVNAVSSPPSIIQQPDYDVFYKAQETVRLPCVAEGYPTPSYQWLRDGKVFNPSGNDDRVVQLKGIGTLVITKPESKDQGIFQCFAINPYGTSVSINANLREVKLKHFQAAHDVTVTPQLGDSLTLPCVPPESVPQPHVFWVIKESQGGQFKPINYDGRVSMDLENRLRFTNVIAADHAGGRAYACMASNAHTRNSTQGRQYFVDPIGNTEVLHPVTYMWASPQDHMGLQGSNMSVKCIFAGNPTPDVHWERVDGRPLPDGAKVQSFGQELKFTNLQVEDGGTYECWATNTNSRIRVQRTVSLRVESRPSWLLEPQDVVVGVGGKAEFNCRAKGVPEPQYFWFINGKPLERATESILSSDRFRRPRSDRVVFVNLNKEDPLVVQCNATNKHGYVWGDAYLNVLSEAPTILKPPQERLLVAEGMSINMTCTVTGKPDPIITWFKDDQQITGGRYKILTTGDLMIKTVVLADAGLYRCKAENTHNWTEASGVLVVRRKTLIEQSPRDLETTAGQDAKFTCSGTTDPEEVNNLRIMWLKDNNEVDTSVHRMFSNFQDNSLTISGTIIRDSGSYTCIATNGLDSASASAMLTVRGKPSRVSEVTVQQCNEDHAILEWMPGSYNNAPVQYFLVQYNTTFNPDIWTFAAQVDSIYTTANISLSPWVNYTFRVIAYNKFGESHPSPPSKIVCHTNADVPDSNPKNLRTIGDQRGYLHIQWTPMPMIEQNGEGFQYILKVNKEGYPDDVTTNYLEWKTFEFLHPAGSELYQAYHITLQAKNVVGTALKDPVVLRGFTGEDIPTLSVNNLNGLDIGDTYAVLQWDMDYSQIDSDHTPLNGQFRGFKIQYWQRTNKVGTLREVDVSAEDVLETRVGSTWQARVDNLLPNTDLAVTVAVRNNFYVSRPSDSYEFRTTAGFPGPVELLQPINIGDNHVNLEWKQPIENRGSVLGYDIGYQTVTGLDLGEMQERDPQVTDPYATTAMLSGLLTHTKYRVHIWARTAKGRGEGYFIELLTTQSGDPQAPRFTISDVGAHHINVTWWINPYAPSGTVVYVEYRKEDGPEWLQTTDEVTSTHQSITTLEAGTTYEVRLVATNGGTRKISHVEEVTTDGTAMASALVGNYGWFLGMMLALFLIIGLLIFFTVIFKRGARFKQHGSSPAESYADAATYSGTDVDNTSHIPRQSSRFGPEPRGYHNDYYDDKDTDDTGDKSDKRYISYHGKRPYDDGKQHAAGNKYGRDETEKDEYGFDRGDYDDRRDDYNRNDYDDRRDDYDYRRNDYDEYRRDDYDERRKNYDYSRDYDDHDDRRNYGRDRDYDDRRHDYGKDDFGRGDRSYEEYEHQPNTSYDPEVDDKDLREPSRFDRHGVPVGADRTDRRPPKSSGSAGVLGASRRV